MISLYSTWWVKPGEESALAPALKNLAKAVLENEAGTLMYLVHAPLFNFPSVAPDAKPIVSEPMIRPGTLIFFEKYDSWDAFKAHLYGTYFTDFVKEHKQKFVLGNDGNPFVEVVFMEEQTGFIKTDEQILKTIKKPSDHIKTQSKLS